jgi:hypothetical protein
MSRCFPLICTLSHSILNLLQSDDATLPMMGIDDKQVRALESIREHLRFSPILYVLTPYTHTLPRQGTVPGDFYVFNTEAHPLKAWDDTQPLK